MEVIGHIYTGKIEKTLTLTSLGPMVLEVDFSGATVEDMRLTGTMSRRQDGRG